MRTTKGIFAVTSLCLGLTGCYVVPLQPYPPERNVQPGYAAVPVPAPIPVYTARLYPVNDAASAMGRISGTISNPDRGRGEFSLMVGAESYVGEATRSPNSTRGSANAAGNRGGYIKCDYTMNSSILGSGSCSFSNGARYDMHISQ